MKHTSVSSKYLSKRSVPKCRFNFPKFSKIDYKVLSQFYDTIIGVGNSGTNGEFKVSGMFDHDDELTPFRGVRFDSDSVPGTSLQFMVDNVDRFIELAEGRTLFVVRTGLNDLNTYMSAGGVGTGASGNILAWEDIPEEHREDSEERYRTLIGELEKHGDVALATLTYVNAKGVLTSLDDNGRNLHAGSWNDNLVIPLCKELTPKFFNSATQRPYFDYYLATYDDPTTLDDDNLHFYDDRDYKARDAGYPDGMGSYTSRKVLIDSLVATNSIPPNPFEDKFVNRLRINFGNEVAMANRPFLNRDGNNVVLEELVGEVQSLSTYDDSILPEDINISWEASNNFLYRLNNTTSSLPFREDLIDRNALSSGVFIHQNRTFSTKISNVGKGVLSLVGIYSTTGDDEGMLTRAIISDDLGERWVEYNNCFDNNGNTFSEDKNVGEIEYDCRNSGEMTITLEASGTATYGGVSCVMFDIESF